MKPLSLIDMIDSGADDNEPVKEVTHGHLRQWHDMIANMHNLVEKLNHDFSIWSSYYDDLSARLDAEKKIVDRAYGIIRELIADEPWQNAPYALRTEAAEMIGDVL